MEGIFALEFMRRAFAVGMMVALVAPTIGIFFVVRRLSAIADTLAHVSLAGVALGVVMNWATIPTALVASTLAIFGIEHLREKKTIPAETIISLYLFGGLAIGALLLGFARGKNVNVMNYLFGNIVAVTRGDVISIAAIGVLVLLCAFIFWRSFFAISIDEEMALAGGLPVRWLNRLLAILGAATIVISMNVVGVLLIGALMVVPVLAAMQFQKGFYTTWVIALCLSVFSVLGGLIASYYGQLASGGTIVLFAIACFFLSTFFNKQAV